MDKVTLEMKQKCTDIKRITLKEKKYVANFDKPFKVENVMWNEFNRK